MSLPRTTPTLAALLGLLALSSAILAAGAQAAPEGSATAAQPADDPERMSRFPKPALLAVHVTKAGENGTIDPVANATIELTRIRPEGSSDPVRSETTNDNGFARFALRRGEYIVKIDADGLNASADVVVRKHTRLDVYFDADGIAHIFEVHRPLWKHGHRAHLLVAHLVQVDENGTKSPIENATVTISKPGGEDDELRSKQTGPRGNAAFLLPKGKYEVSVIAGDLKANAIVELGEKRERGEVVCFKFAADGTPTVNEECRRR